MTKPKPKAVLECPNCGLTLDATKQHEQGKLEEGKRIVQIARKHVDKTNLRSFGYLSADELVDWLKSQLKLGLSDVADKGGNEELKGVKE